MATVKEMCDEVAWLDSGQLQQIGPAQQVIDAYQLTV
jgi:ABC-type polysaccharide/polyol phosphate transport system ATPase subunit